MQNRIIKRIGSKVKKTNMGLMVDLRNNIPFKRTLMSQTKMERQIGAFRNFGNPTRNEYPSMLLIPNFKCKDVDSIRVIYDTI